MKKISLATVLLLFFILIACTKQAIKIPAITTLTLPPSHTPSPTSTPLINLSITEYPTATESNIDCWKKTRLTSISPDGDWCSIGYYFPESQKVLVKKNNGTTWQIPVEKFIEPEEIGSLGNISPYHWSKDGKFLFFSLYLGWDGGGTQCFNYGNADGLYRFDLESGIVDTIIKPDWGHIFAFSPTDRYLATDLDGVSIIDFLSSKTTLLNSTKPQSFRWSPDGRYLAYSVATCGIELDNNSSDNDWWNVASSSAYIYDTQTGQTTVMLRSDKQLLKVGEWEANSKTLISGEQYIGNKLIAKEYLFNFNSGMYTNIETTTPNP
jgi:hypothetical protein